MDTPRFTVVTPSFNQGAFIEKTIDSVLSQGHPNLEYIIIDGGSKDNTVEVIKKYERHLAYWVSEPDRGQSHAINKGFARATGKYLAWLNSDDWFVNEALYVFSSVFATSSNLDVVVGRGQIVDMNGTVVSDKTPASQITHEWLCKWISGNYFMQPSCAFTRAAWNKTGGLAESIHMAMDLDLWLRFAKAGCSFGTIDTLLSLSLSHSSAKTTAFAYESLLDAARVISAHGSNEGYETLVQRLLKHDQHLRHKLKWYENNHDKIFRSHFLRLSHPIIKRLSTDGQYWQRDAPNWSE